MIIDLAAPTGGNCELTKADEVVEHKGVKIAASPTCRPGSPPTVPRSTRRTSPTCCRCSSTITARRRRTDDEVIQGMALTKEGAVVHPSLVKEGA